MKCIIVGLGSMGKRRLRLIKKNFSALSVVGVDSRYERREIVEKEYWINTYEDIETAIVSEGNIDIAFVCAPPLAHADIISQCLNKNMHIFSELDLVTDKYDENLKLAEEKQLKMFLSSTPMYHREIEYISEQVLASIESLNYIYHVGQHLSDWHPWESYKDFFVADKRTNGCREILAIELPWITNAFGDVDTYHVMSSKASDLDINYNDNYFIMLKHKSGHKGVLVVDVICREASKQLEIFGEQLYMTWSGSPNSLMVKNINNKSMDKLCLFENVDKLEQYSLSIIEDMYLAELQDFFAVIDGNSYGKHTYSKSSNILRLIDEIENN